VLPSAQVGSYSIAMSFRELGMTPLRTYAGVFQNLLVDRNRNHADDSRLVIVAILLQFLCSATLTAAAAAVFPFVLPLLYGTQFAQLAGTAVVLFGSAMFLSVAGLCWIVFNMRGRPGLTSQIVTISGLLGPAMVWMLTMRAGLYGAAWAGVLSSLVVCIGSLFALVRLRGYSARQLLAVAQQLPATLRDVRLGILATRQSAIGSIEQS
jgi:O-antigen/teichoic acid export membrane protein